MSERENVAFSWHAEVGDEKCAGRQQMRLSAILRQQSAVYLMKRDPQAGTLKEKIGIARTRSITLPR